METIEQIKQQLETLTKQVNELTEVSEYSFSKAQLIKFVEKLHEGFVTSLKANIQDIDFDEGCVELDLDSYSNQININIDSRSISNQVIDYTDLDTNLDEDAVECTINDIYKEVKGA